MTPIANNPQYAKAVQEINDLSAAQGKVNTRIQEIGVLLNSDNPHANEGHVEAALEFAATGKVVRPTAGPAELNEEHALLSKQSEAIRRAMLEKHTALHRLQGELSVQVNAEIEAQHRKLAGRYLSALQQLDAIAEEELKMIQAVERAGYSVRLREYVRWPVIGLLRESGGSCIWHKVKELSYYART